MENCKLQGDVSSKHDNCFLLTFALLAMGSSICVFFKGKLQELFWKGQWVITCNVVITLTPMLFFQRYTLHIPPVVLSRGISWNSPLNKN